MQPRLYVLSVRPPHTDRGGDVTDDYRIIDPAQPLAHPNEGWIARHRHVLLLVHGYNDTASFAKGVYAEMIENLEATAGLFDKRGAPDAVICFQWPGDVAVVSWLPFLDVFGYSDDLANCKLAAARLVTFFERVRAWGGNLRQISVITHSMGGRVLLEALRVDPTPEIEVVGMMAGAVPSDLADPTRQGADLVGTDAPPHRIRKYRSSSDMVLALAFPLGQTQAYLAGNETAAYAEAVGAKGDPLSFGIELPDTGLGHSDYWPSTDVAYDIAVAIEATCRTRPALGRRQRPSRNLPPPFPR